jgi:integrase
MDRDEGIRQIGKNLYAIRVKRINRRTGRQENRKATVSGTKADARRKRDEIRSELASTVGARQRIRLSAFAAWWLEQRAPRLKGPTLRRYGFSLEHIVPALGDFYVDALTPSDISAYIAKRVREAEGNTVLNELRCLRTMAKDSIHEGYAERDWCARVASPKVRRYTKKRPNLLTAEQFHAVIEHIHKRWRGLVMFMVTTGLRWGETSALHWQDIDWKAGEASITRSNDRGTLTESTKTGTDRSVPVLAEVAELWGARRATGLVFPNRKGRPHRGYPLIKVLAAACKLAGVERVTVHGLRRTFNNLARQLTSREVLKSITGHVTDTMVEHYSFVGADEKTRAARAVAGVLKVSPRKTDNAPN